MGRRADAPGRGVQRRVALLLAAAIVVAGALVASAVVWTHMDARRCRAYYERRAFNEQTFGPEVSEALRPKGC